MDREWTGWCTGKSFLWRLADQRISKEARFSRELGTSYCSQLPTPSNKSSLIFTIMATITWQRTAATFRLEMPSTRLPNVKQVEEGENHGETPPRGRPSERSQPSNFIGDYQQNNGLRNKEKQVFKGRPAAPWQAEKLQREKSWRVEITNQIANFYRFILKISFHISSADLSSSY